MKKTLSLIALGMTFALGLHAGDWKEDLVSLNPEVIDSVKSIPSSAYGPKWLRSYWIYYHQPLVHDEPELGDFPLRALFTIRHQEDYTNLMTQVNIGGYNLDSYIATYPNYYANYYFGCSGGELAGRYKGNFLQPEHRYFGESCPDNPWTTLGYCEAKEAAADFHALLEAMKKVFHGKWAISGVSKGGTTTAIQHAFYPEDADCFVPYSGPFLGNVGDVRMQERWMTEAWTPEMRESMLHIQKAMLNRDIYPLYRQYYGWGEEYDEWDDYLRCFFLETVGLLDCNLHAYSSQNEVNDIFSKNSNFLNKKELEDYTDEMLLYMVVNGSPSIGNDYDSWYRRHFGNKTGDQRNALARMSNESHPFTRRLPMPVFSIPESEWSNSDTGYWYQAAHELGYFDLKYDFFYDTQEEADSVNAIWQNWTINVMMLGNDTYQEVEFNPDLMAEVRYNTAHSDSKVLFIYGNDDLWTGACMDDDCVNGENIRQYILPEQNHGVCINDVKDPELRDELWAFTDAIFIDDSEAIVAPRVDTDATATYYDMWGRPISATRLRNIIVVKGQ